MAAEDLQDPASAEARWTSLRAALARAVRRQCPRWLTDHADDLAQAALMKIMGAAPGGEGERTLSSFYLYRVAHSALVDEIRRRQRRREVSLDGDDSAQDHGVPEPRPTATRSGTRRSASSAPRSDAASWTWVPIDGRR